jgi:nitrile hydratase accessory protein
VSASAHDELETTFAGAAALPRSNGELVFEHPWESRAFGMVVGLHEAGVFEWADFRERLVARIAAWDAAHGADEPYSYYEHWLGALQDVLAAQGHTDGAAVEALTAEILARPAGADHDHHDHEHAGHRHGHGHPH